MGRETGCLCVCVLIYQSHGSIFLALSGKSNLRGQNANLGLSFWDPITFCTWWLNLHYFSLSLCHCNFLHVFVWRSLDKILCKEQLWRVNQLHLWQDGRFWWQNTKAKKPPPLSRGVWLHNVSLQYRAFIASFIHSLLLLWLRVPMPKMKTNLRLEMLSKKQTASERAATGPAIGNATIRCNTLTWMQRGNSKPRTNFPADTCFSHWMPWIPPQT